MVDIKLYVASHKAFPVPKNPVLFPIYLGNQVDLLPKDNTGLHISHKNPYYCELTAQYWAWKNEEADYYGFFHYRRYLVPNKNISLPYILEKCPDETFLQKYCFQKFQQLIPQYDLISPKGENMYLPVEQHYRQAPYHHGTHLDKAKEILLSLYPAYEGAMMEYFSQGVCYFGNMYIMSRDVFWDYCQWLFPMLEVLEDEIDFEPLSVEEKRVIGYVAERLFGVYYTYKKSELRVLELPRVHFEPDFKIRQKKQLVNILLPAGSRRRFWVKQRRKR